MDGIGVRSLFLAAELVGELDEQPGAAIGRYTCRCIKCRAVFRLRVTSFTTRTGRCRARLRSNRPAAIRLAVNLISMRLLSAGKESSLNMKGAYLKVWSDMLGSVGVIVGAVLIRYTAGNRLPPSTRSESVSGYCFGRRYCN